MGTVNNVLIGLGDDVQVTGLLVLDNPGPAGALDSGKLAIDITNQAVETAVLGSDGLAERRVKSRRLTATS